MGSWRLTGVRENSAGRKQMIQEPRAMGEDGITYLLYRGKYIEH